MNVKLLAKENIILIFLIMIMKWKEFEKEILAQEKMKKIIT